MTAHFDSATLVVTDDPTMSAEVVALWVRERLDGWLEHELAAVGVVVGELLDNARRHGGTPCVLRLSVDFVTRTLLVSVRDRCAGAPKPWARGAGLLLVEAQSTRWGVVSEPGTTTAWAELRFDD
ncbi:ATP-binding protein [Saccharothrix sp.]|uniref:ATP-binding protein n=1 Tax=Saccharothrix sp. TaxID=1873460 RepID=UPI002810BC87|nr:ATP-binding protein [Saccharothrix sp.]